MHDHPDGYASGLSDELLANVRELVGQRIRARREERRLSQDAAARLAGFDQSEWSRVENAKTDARLSTLLRIQRVLDIETLESLIGLAPSRAIALAPQTDAVTRRAD